MSNYNNENQRRCSFCNAPEKHVQFLIPSQTGHYICNNCIDVCNEIIYEHTHMDSEFSLSAETLPRPAEIKETLDKYIKM